MYWKFYWETSREETTWETDALGSSIKMDLIRKGQRVMYWIQITQDSVKRYVCNETSVSIKCGEFPHQLKNY